ncbi:AC4 protein [Corchorus golden mosaic virus [Bangladesh:Sirajganj:2013]]|uniref:AC4 n=1 Tax=Corchorus golden mosaic virus TaxID=390436 RepID=A0A1L7NR70_9GEMI|nr:AC4 protein [Corchorus golden mosaic virus [Bangladesh:Sirajganj:2013]]BAW32369.1 AC4 [Corchorus golden mosaic virus]
MGRLTCMPWFSSRRNSSAQIVDYSTSPIRRTHGNSTATLKLRAPPPTPNHILKKTECSANGALSRWTADRREAVNRQLTRLMQRRLTAEVRTRLLLSLRS